MRKRRRKNKKGIVAKANRWLKARRRARRSAWLACAALMVLFGYVWLRAESPPEKPGDLCAVFEEKRSWYRSARASARGFGVPEAVQMAILHQESGFRSKARPPRKRILWVLPGPRPSSAYGYGQVIESTWRQYRDRTGRLRARRTRFGDVAHFMGWYIAEIHRTTGIRKDDAYNLYLAYHEGPTGFLRGSHRSKDWLLRTARSVDDRARRYQRQLTACRERLDSRSWLLPVVILLALLAVGGVGWRRIARH